MGPQVSTGSLLIRAGHPSTPKVMIMTNTDAFMGTHPSSDTLNYKDHEIRIAMFDGVPFFVLDDLSDAMGWGSFDSRRVHSEDFPSHAKRVCQEETEDGFKDMLALSPVGVWLFTTEVDPYKGAGLAAWAKREAIRLCPNPAAKDPAMFLTMSETGQLPPSPTKFSGRRSEWLDLKNSDEYLEARYGLKIKTRSRVETQRTILEAAEKARREPEA